MSIVAPDHKKPWILIAAAIGLALALGAMVALVDLPGKRLLSLGGRGSGDVAAIPGLPQATWEMRVHASGVDGVLTRAQKKALERQRPKLRSLVKKVYDSLFVHPNRLQATLKKNFSEPAAVALRRAGPGATTAGRVSTTLRRARIGIQAAGGARMAVASVTVRALADGDGRPVVHRSALWLERARGDWKVVAFDVRQAPLSERTGSDGKAGRKHKKATGKNP